MPTAIPPWPHADFWDAGGSGSPPDPITAAHRWLADDPARGWDFLIFYEAQGGAWESIAHMQRSLTQLEWYRHVAYLQQRQAEIEKSSQPSQSN